MTIQRKYDPTDKNSPTYKGDLCLRCLEHSFLLNEVGLCPNCADRNCKSCGEMHPPHELIKFAGRKICSECFEYENN